MTEPEPTRDELPDRMFICTICGWLHEEDRGVPEEDIPHGPGMNGPGEYVLSEVHEQGYPANPVQTP